MVEERDEMYFLVKRAAKVAERGMERTREECWNVLIINDQVGGWGELMRDM